MLRCRQFCVLVVILSAVFLIPSISFSEEDRSKIPIPFINPGGDLAVYRTISHGADRSREVELTNPNGQVSLVKIRGEYWTASMAAGEDAAEMKQTLLPYIKSIKGTVLFESEDRIDFSVEKGKYEVWWGFASLRSYLELTIIKENRLKAGQSLSFKLGKDAKADGFFYVDIPGETFNTLFVTVPDGVIDLHANMVTGAGFYRKNRDHAWQWNAKRGARLMIDTLPQDKGKCIFHLSRRYDAPQVEITLNLEENPVPVPPVKMGEAVGALRIKNVPYGRARIEPEYVKGSVSVSHPEYPSSSEMFRNGDLTPDGDIYLRATAGLWKVAVQPRNKGLANTLHARHIPINSGEETVLQWPASMTGVFGVVGDGGLKINTVAAAGGKGQITFSLLGKDARGVKPVREAIEVLEGGIATRILDVKPSQTPLDVVLLLDSSGSMKGQMKKALAATKSFVKSLPDNAAIRVVDFDTKPKLLKGTTKAQVLKSLGAVKANGATSLNDSVLLGLSMLKDSKRPALLLFTDGFDANWNDTGPGSKATKKQVLKAVPEAGVPVFTIGFGKNHDRDTLPRIASLSGGQYFPAENQKALTDVYALINSNLGNTFEVTYRRPEKSRPSDVPVISYVVDISGSMDNPLADGKGYRNDKVTELLHDFILGLPGAILGQVISFDGAIYFNQVMTDRKADLLRSLSMLKGNSEGTDILGAVDMALKSQAAVPSSQRTMVFITDAALDVPAGERKKFETLLGRLKDENIRCLWIGIGSDLGEKGFKRAAAKTGGRYVLTEDPAVLTSAFTDLTAEIRQTAETVGKPLTLLQLTVKHREKSGRNLAFAGSDKVELPPLKTDNTVEVPASITYSFKKLKSRYDGDIADLVTGDSVPVRDAQIAERLPIGVSGANKAAAIEVKEALFMNRLRGVKAPADKRFLALTMELKNVLPVQDVRVYPDGANHPAAWLGNSEATKGVLKKMVPTYLIPDLKRHLFLRWNRSQMVTLSPATWLAAAPLTLPGEDAVALGPKKPVKGTCVYLVPAEAMDQLSLHFYDMNYGHMDIPLVGTMPATAERLSKLPPKTPVRLSDAFQIALREVRDIPRIGDFKAGDGMVFRIVEADLISNVQALLDINPAQRFSLRLTTQAGALHIPLHNATALLPLGFMSPTMLSPGSSNRIRLAFRVPKGLAKGDKGELVIDLKGSGVVIALGKKPTGKKKTPPAGKRLAGDGIDLVINQVGRIDDRGTYQVVDITLFDKKDGNSTSLSNAFILKRKGFKDTGGGASMRTPEELTQAKRLSGFASGNSLTPVGLLDPAPETANRLFGFTEQTVVPDGQHLRGVLLFRLPGDDDNPADWQLASPFFKSLNQGMQKAPYKQKQLLVKRLQINVDPGSNYAQALETALVAVVRERKAAAFKKPGSIEPARTDLENSGPPRREVPVPDVTAAGDQQFKDIRDIKTLKARLAKVRWLPAGRHGSWAYRFAPEAVLTQNWGSEGDFARMAEVVFARQGTKTRREYVDLTDKGRTALARLCKLEQVEMGTLPALVYYDSKDRKQLLVVPFMKDLEDLTGLVTDNRKDEVDNKSTATGSIHVSLRVVPKEQTARGTAGDMGSALAGDTEAGAGEWVKVFYHSPELPSLSRGAVDIGFAVVGYKNGPLVTAVFDGNKKRIVGQETVDTGEFRVVGGKLEINLGHNDLVREFSLSEGEKITGYFHTLGLNLPDLGTQAAKALDARMQAERDGVDNPDDLSGLRWYTRHKIAQFIAAQTRFENDLAARLKLVTGRVTHPRAVMVTVSRPSTDTPVVTRLDLRQIHNDIHNGSEKNRAAFNIASGIFCSQLEERLLGDEATGYFKLLKYYPKGTRLRWLTRGDRYPLYDRMRALEYPERVVKLLEASPNTVLFPSSPAVVDGKLRWAWLEVDPDTYRTITVLDNGDHGSMTEKAMTDFGQDATSYVGGAMLGVSTSVWGVAGFSLILGDYDKILSAAKAFVLGLGEMYTQKVSVDGVGEVSADVGKKPQASYTGKFASFKEMVDALVAGPKAELGGFDQGFKDGAAIYFHMAK